jgi:hypothetical protein
MLTENRHLGVDGACYEIGSRHFRAEFISTNEPTFPNRGRSALFAISRPHGIFAVCAKIGRRLRKCRLSGSGNGIALILRTEGQAA